MPAQRIREDVLRLSHRGLGVREFALAAARAVGRRVPHDGVCVLTMDPATLLPTGEVVENGLPAAATERLTQIELSEPDFNKFSDLARGRTPAASLSQATERVLDRSVRHRELKRPSGFDDELRAVFAGDTGTWGAITLLRESGAERFSPEEVSLVSSLTPYLAEGLRRAILNNAVAGDGADDQSVGLVLLDEGNGSNRRTPPRANGSTKWVPASASRRCSTRSRPGPAARRAATPAPWLGRGCRHRRAAGWWCVAR